AVEVRGREVVLVQAARTEAVQVQEAGAGLADVARERGEERAGAHGVAARALSLEPLAEPEQRRARSVKRRSFLDRGRRHARRGLAPARRAPVEQRLELVRADRVRCDEVSIEAPVSA